MAYAEAANNGVKRRRGEWQILGTRFAEVQGRVECTRENNHRRRDISANYERAALGRPASQLSRSARHIEKSRSFSNLSGVEQWLDCPVSHRRERIVIGFSEPIVGGLFEITECLQATFRLDHHSPPRVVRPRLRPFY